MLRSLIALTLLLAAAAAPAAVDAKAVHARLVALDAQFASAIAAKDVASYRKVRAQSESLTNSLGLDPTEPCRAASIHLESSRTQEWIDRHKAKMSDADRRIARSNREDFEGWLEQCKQSAR